MLPVPYLSRMKKRNILLLALLVALPVWVQAQVTQRVEPGRQNIAEQRQKPYVILISADGFRHDYADKYKAKNLQALRASGVAAASMLPSFPSNTFPNHYTLVTGMYPANHGLTDNSFYDPQRQDTYSLRDRAKVEDGTWYGGTPLWVLAEQQGMLAASFYWAASEADIQGIRPTYWYPYTESITFKKRIKAVVDWLSLPEEQRPHLITFYIPDTDHAGHRFGPESPETASEVRRLDRQLKQLTQAVAATGLPVNFIFVSDHGMTQVERNFTINVPPFIKNDDFKMMGGGTILELHALKQSAIAPMYKRLKELNSEYYEVYLKEELPAHLHYGKANDTYNRVGDIVLLARHPKVFGSPGRVPSPGTHGYDPTQVPDMHATFYAWGPAFKTGLQIPTFQNTQVYNIVTQILGLPYRHHIDGDSSIADSILK